MSHFIERSGHCYDGYTLFLGCAFEPNECRAKSASFKPTTEMRCDPNKRRIGRCIKENTCALRPFDCATDSNESNFKEKDDDCTIQRDKSIDWNVDSPAFTKFGSCKNMLTGEYFCIFDPLDCDDGTEWVYVTPDETMAACDCSEVHVTACKNSNDDIMCAVKAESCAEGYNAISPYAQMVNRGNETSLLDCRLCVKINTAEPTFAPSLFETPIPTLPPTTFAPKSGLNVPSGDNGLIMCWLPLLWLLQIMLF
mmetsp:Transcript_21867/g.26722  ORF Transcript_21867/g.26722 Transcript_21867/m.26722 type:complete len:253 (-) Transcript_21867:126-884(-)